MKMRMGFVSNSSSSSFCILGMTAKSQWTENILNDYERHHNALCIKVYENWRESFLETVDGLENYSGTLIGITIDTYETKYADKKLNEVKEIIAEEIRKVFYDKTISSHDISFHTDGGYDG